MNRKVPERSVIEVEMVRSKDRRKNLRNLDGCFISIALAFFSAAANNDDDDDDGFADIMGMLSNLYELLALLLAIDFLIQELRPRPLLSVTKENIPNATALFRTAASRLALFSTMRAASAPYSSAIECVVVGLFRPLPIIEFALLVGAAGRDNVAFSSLLLDILLLSCAIRLHFLLISGLLMAREIAS